MKVCHITSVHPRYDIRIFIKECQALAREHQVSLIVADSLGDEIHTGINIYDMGKVAGGRLKRMRVTSQAIFNQVCALKPQVVHFHDPELIGIGRKLVKLGYQVIYDVHEDVPKQIMNKHWIPKLLRPVISRYVELQECKAANEFAGVICATEIITQRFVRYNPKSIAIHNYPILAELTQLNVTWQQRSDHLCYLGSISETRGILPLVDSLALSGLTLDLAGPYSGDSESKIKASRGFNQVNYHGILNRQQVSELLGQVKIGMVTLLATPSYLESLPIKLFEYMLAGIPVITSNFPLWQSIVQGHNCGLMVDPSDAQAIAAACNWLLENQEQAKQMGENGRQAVLNHYTWDQEQERLLAFYRQLN